MANNYLFVNGNVVQSYVGGSLGVTYSNVANVVFANNVAVTQKLAVGKTTADSSIDVTGDVNITGVVSKNLYQITNGPCFRASPSQVQAYTANTSDNWQLFEFDTKTFDPDLSYDTSLKRFIPPIAGFYHICAQVIVANSVTGFVNNALFETAIYKNNALYSTGTRIQSPNATFMPTSVSVINDLIYLNGTGDGVDIRVNYVLGTGSTDKTFYFGNARSHFKGFFVHGGPLS